MHSYTLYCFLALAANIFAIPEILYLPARYLGPNAVGDAGGIVSPAFRSFEAKDPNINHWIDHIKLSENGFHDFTTRTPFINLSGKLNWARDSMRPPSGDRGKATGWVYYIRTAGIEHQFFSVNVEAPKEHCEGWIWKGFDQWLTTQKFPYSHIVAYDLLDKVDGRFDYRHVSLKEGY